MRNILIVMGRYLPGYKDGGPVRSIKNLVDRLGTEYKFHILTVDRDHGDTQAYPGIQYDTWNQVGDAKVWYVQPGGFTKEVVKRLADEVDLVYVCGCFNDYARTVMALKKRNVIKVPVVIASMGLFSPGAFRIKYPKKKAYVMVLKDLGYFDKVAWSATSEEEAADIRRQVGKHAICYLAEDLPRKPVDIHREKSSDRGYCKVVFLSRISRKKNLTYAAEILRKWGETYPNQQIQFDVYGNKEDPVYVAECEEQLKQLPENVEYHYRGIAPAEEIIETFAKYDVFLFPTRGENYGHVIFEAMAGGCVPIISNQTPWTEEKMGHCGYMIPLSEPIETWTETLEQYMLLEQSEKERLAKKSMDFAKEYVAAEDDYRKILNMTE